MVEKELQAQEQTQEEVEQTHTDEKAQELSAQKTMLESNIGIKEVLDDFILITYDIPNNEEGNKVRTEFYHTARRIGAVMHTESVYYMPWTQAANIAALSIAEKGKVFVWYSKTSGDTARELTIRYDMVIKNWIDELDERIEKITGHIESGKVNLADNMMERTVSTLLELDNIVKERKSSSLTHDVAGIKNSIRILLTKLIDAKHKRL